MEAQRHIGYESDVQNSTPMGPMAGYAAVAVEAKRTAAAIEADRLEAIKTLEKDSFNLGDLNPLIHPLDLTRKESVEAIKHVIMNNIRTNNGLEPVIMESALVTDPNMEQSALRFVTRFEVKRPKKRQIQLLEELVADTYDAATVRTRTDSKGNDIPLESYPPIQMGEEMRSKTSGWFMGVGPVPTSPLYEGLYVFKDLGKVTKDNFLEKTDGRSKFIIEIREGSLEQADLVTFITQVSAILGKDQKMPDKGQLLYE